jgi:putative transcriptional regulator
MRSTTKEPPLLRAKRIGAGLTQGELARKLGVTRQLVSLWDCGDAFPAPKHIPLLAEVFKQKPEHLAREIERERRTLVAV